MYHMDADKAYREKGRRELHQNATWDIEQILEATSHETAVLRPPTSYLENHPNKTNKTVGEAKKLISDVLLWASSQERTNKNLPTTALCGHRMQSRRLAGSNG